MQKEQAPRGTIGVRGVMRDTKTTGRVPVCICGFYGQNHRDYVPSCCDGKVRRAYQQRPCKLKKVDEIFVQRYAAIVDSLKDAACVKEVPADLVGAAQQGQGANVCTGSC